MISVTKERVSVKIDPKQSTVEFIAVLLGRPDHGAIKDVKTELDSQSGLLEVSADSITREELKAALIELGHTVVD